jgi:hypothetical protein
VHHGERHPPRCRAARHHPRGCRGRRVVLRCFIRSRSAHSCCRLHAVVRRQRARARLRGFRRPPHPPGPDRCQRRVYAARGRVPGACDRAGRDGQRRVARVPRRRTPRSWSRICAPGKDGFGASTWWENEMHKCTNARMQKCRYALAVPTFLHSCILAFVHY